MNREKIYYQWNGKNIDGKVEYNNHFLSKEAANSNTSDMKYIIGVDTFSADELQQDVEY